MNGIYTHARTHARASYYIFVRSNNN